MPSFSRPGLSRAFCRGVLSELMSVHRMPFLASLFAVTLPAHQVPLWFFGLLVLATVLIAILWYSLVAALAAALSGST